MRKKEVLKALDRVYCRLAPSKIHGVGVFAIRDIPKGTNPFTDSPSIAFVKVKPTELSRQQAVIRKLIEDFCPLQKGRFYLPAKGMGAIDVSYYLNTSKTPNMLEQGEGEDFIAARDIKAGEELTVDYDTYSENPDEDFSGRGL